MSSSTAAEAREASEHRGARLLGIAVGVAVVVLAVAGCSADVGGGDSSDASADLELLIQQQLPGQARKLGAGPVVVRSVDCVGASETKYDCVAQVSGVDVYGKRVNASVSIEGTCGETDCVWRSTSGL